MKKNLLFLLIAFVMFCAPSDAKVFKGKALEEISTKNPVDTISVEASRKIKIGDIEIKKGDIIIGKMTNIKKPEKWHHNASFTFIPQYYIDKSGTQHKITKEIKATYRQKMKPDYKNSDIMIGSFHFSPGYITDTQKALHGEGKEVVEDYMNRKTPWGKGIEIEIKAGERIYFNFPE